MEVAFVIQSALAVIHPSARRARDWQRGYSDRVAGKHAEPLPFHDAEAYRAGYSEAEQELGGLD